MHPKPQSATLPADGSRGRGRCHRRRDGRRRRHERRGDRGRSHRPGGVLDPGTLGRHGTAARTLRTAASRRGSTSGTRSRPHPGCASRRQGSRLPWRRATLRGAGIHVHDAPEALALCPDDGGVLACGRDPRGLTYALLELADRVRNASDPLAAIAVPTPRAERPANTVRSVTRLFTSDVEDTSWFNDRGMWPEYLSLLATQRFNRFSLAFGIGYDFLTNVTDAYFLFAYPFLLSVPGYDVRVPQLPDAERDRNLEMLRFIAQQTVTRGLDFQLGLWMHGYKWNASPNPNYTIEGLTPETHGPYCRDAVRALLKAIPEISGVTFRVHGESGVEEGSYQFWKTVFDGVATCGRRVEIDMHAKGMDEGLIAAALGSGQPVKISPKYWAEHLGLPYHQADIRAQEWPRTDAPGLMKFSAGSRNFLRYGYGDLLREDRKYGVIHRVWPGTQRLLIWGDPVTAASYSRAFSFCGSDGAEIMEPLSFKGRRGSGIAGGRCAYADASLNPRWDWQKYAYSLRVWGRLLYNPDAEPDVWQRAMRREFGPAGPDLENALARSSRILPTVTTAHLPSAANNAYWPEVYLNQSLIDGEHGPYTDTPTPKVFGAVSPLDPQLFYRVDDFADALLDGTRSGKYTPIEVACWLEDHAAAATESLASAERRAGDRTRPEYRRLVIDIAVAADLGRFFAAKLRAGVLYRLFDRTGNRAALEEALRAYRTARAAWAAIVARTRDVYAPTSPWASSASCAGTGPNGSRTSTPTSRPSRPGSTPGDPRRQTSAIDARHRRGHRPARPAGRDRPAHATGAVPARRPACRGVRGREGPRVRATALPAREPGRALAGRVDEVSGPCVGRDRSGRLHAEPVPASVLLRGDGHADVCRVVPGARRVSWRNSRTSWFAARCLREFATTPVHEVDRQWARGPCAGLGPSRNGATTMRSALFTVFAGSDVRHGPRTAGEHQPRLQPAEEHRDTSFPSRRRSTRPTSATIGRSSCG